MRVIPLVMILALATACSSQTPAPTVPAQEPAAVLVSATDYRFIPATLVVATGTRIELRNEGGLAHTWTVLADPIEDALELDDATVLAELRVEVGQSATTDLSGIPPGNYQVVCAIVGHFAAGMVGEIVVDG